MNRSERRKPLKGIPVPLGRGGRQPNRLPAVFANLDFDPKQTTIRAIIVSPENTEEDNWELVEKGRKIVDPDSYETDSPGLPS